MSFVDQCVGQRFGRLVVESVSMDIDKRRRVADCVCDCGNRKRVDARMLKRGDTTSCGCLHKERVADRRSLALIGQNFGRLKVVSQAERKLVGTRLRANLAWNCVCECGSHVVLTSNALSSGNTKSCGCLARDIARERHENSASYISQARRMQERAVRRGKEWTIQLEDAAVLIQKPCNYCGQAPEVRKRPKKLKFHGLDRIDSSKGYHKDNVITCCTRCNCAKNDMSVTEFQVHMATIHNFLSKGA